MDCKLLLYKELLHYFIIVVLRLIILNSNIVSENAIPAEANTEFNYKVYIHYISTVKYICVMECKKNNKEIILLPAYFKFVGLTIIALAMISPFVIKLFNLTSLTAQKDLYKVFSLNILILGFFMVAWSKDKVETELTNAIRFRALSVSFCFVIFTFLLHPFVDLLFKDPVQDLSAQQIVMNLLFFYIMMFYVLKFNSNKKK